MAGLKWRLTPQRAWDSLLGTYIETTEPVCRRCRTHTPNYGRHALEDCIEGLSEQVGFLLDRLGREGLAVNLQRETEEP